MTGERTIRVYCPTHKTPFMTSPDTVILCEGGGHALAQKFPPDDFWEYCCDCQCFRPSEIRLSGKAQARCMVCERQVARRFLCDGCQVISIESDEAAKRRKPYAVSADGTVEPECPSCHKEASASAVYPHDCPEVEARLVTARETCPFCEARVRPAPPLPPRPGIGQRPADASPAGPFAPTREASVATRRDPPHGFCPNCGKEYTAAQIFCGECGAMLPTRPDDFPLPEPVAPAPHAYQPLPPEAMRTSPPPTLNPVLERLAEGTRDPSPTLLTPPSPAKGVAAVIAAIIGALLLLVGVIASISKSGRGPSDNSAPYVESAESKLSRAISQNDLMSPAGSSARDYYQQLRREGASSGTLADYNEKLLPLLKQRPQQLLESLYEPGGDDGTPSDWEEAAEMLEWATEMAPDDATLKARAVYCRGRVAYLSRGKNKDNALRLWQQAADLDKTWPVPANGVGIIYNERKDYVTARPYFREALRRDPDWAVPYNNLGTSYRRTMNKLEAYENYDRAVSLAPKWGRPHAWLGDMAEEDGNYPRAADEYKAVLDLVPPGTPGYNLDEIRQKYDSARAKASLTYD